MRWYQVLWLDFVVARDYPEQEPAWQVVRWYDVLWLLIPIAGLVFFEEVPRKRWAGVQHG